MSLNNLIKVNTHYTRSINLERDAHSIKVINAYIPTSRALRTFSRIADTFHNKQAPRAWSLIGPYGSGKSSFCVFLAQLLSNPLDRGTQSAQNVLLKTEQNLTAKFVKETKNNGGFFKILITGAPESLSKRLLKSLAATAETYWQNKTGRKPSIIKQIKEATHKETSISEILSLFNLLQEQLEKSSCKGILLVIDELGKFLEYEARHYGANDIYLLQSLAEHACKGSSINLYLFVMLHQSFEQYAKGLGENLKNEWSKVQGRFEEVPFLESAEQTLRVVSAAFKHDFNKKQQTQLQTSTKKIIDVLTQQNAISHTLKYNEAVKLYASCYPLHPVSALVLPLLCQKIAQNERTLFSYLGSHEEFGLQQMLEVLSDFRDYIYPNHIYDYFITNQPAVLGDYLTHRRWVEVVTAIERLGDASEDEINLLKTIGVLNIIGSKGGFKASNELLETCLPTKVQAKKAIKLLKEKSIVTYQRFNHEYRVWQGSDFDLEDALQDELNNIGQFSLAEELNHSKNILPIVARKYTIEIGTLRYFNPIFIDAKSYKNIEKQSVNARIIFFLAADKEDERIFNETVIDYFSTLDIVALSLNGNQLREAVAETLALKRVAINRQELHTDPVAKREFEDRLMAALQAEDKLLKNLLESPTESRWYHSKRLVKLNSKRAMQEKLSQVLEHVYAKTPRIYNELINRDKPSAQANAARNKLLYAMQYHADKEDLGIKKFPAEKALYRAVLKATELHQLHNHKWQLLAPKKASSLYPVWQRIQQFLNSTEPKAKSFIELNQELSAPPYGVKAGLLPILYFAAYLISQHELAIYENRRYRPYFTEEMLDRFVKRPDEFEIQQFKITGLRASIFKQYSKVIKLKSNKTPTLLELAQPLASFMGNLPEYTQKTKRGLDKKAIQVRTAFNLSKSPETLLFEDLPKALGFNDLDENSPQKKLEDFAATLTTILRDFKNAHRNLLVRQRELLAQALHIKPFSLPLSKLRKVISGKYYGLENYTIDTQGLRAFIMRLNKSSHTDEEWLENILMFLGHKPTSQWGDQDQDAAEYRLNDLSRRIIDLERLQLHEKKSTVKMSDDFDVYLLRSIKKGQDIQDEVVAITPESASVIAKVEKDIIKRLHQLDDQELELGALAKIVDRFLTDYKNPNNDTSKQKKQLRKNKQ